MAKKFTKATREFLTINPSDIPGLVILDPRQFSRRVLTIDNKSKVVELAVKVKEFSEKWFSHVLLLAFLLLYACIGAWIFESVEGGFEQQQNAEIRKLREPVTQFKNNLTKRLWNERIKYPMPGDGWESMEMDSRWLAFMEKQFQLFETQVTYTCKRGLDMGIANDVETNKWTFMGGMFFSMTVFTTIGYGDNPPKTRTGQAITMVYAFVGIPLLLMVLADMGKIFTRGIKFIFKYIRRLYYNKSLRPIRRVGRSVGNMGRRATLAGLPFDKYKSSAVIALNKGIAYVPYVQQIKETNNKTDDKPSIPVRGIKNSTKFVSHLESNPNGDSDTGITRAPFIVRTNPTPPQTAASSPPITPIPPEGLFDYDDDEFNLPISLAIIILIIYLLIGAIIFWSSEKWSLLHAFYFVFISMSTIGFGDFVPSNQNVLLAAFIYLFFGLALTSMCINVVQIKLSATFQRAKLLVGESIGLDVQEMLRQELEAETREKDRTSREPSAEVSNARLEVSSGDKNKTRKSSKNLEV
ncbi:potassium channel subfamily K member 2-like [Oppia nitens]|uniref:potassium channel subfamily K member 2-like n=1 Tax=Oppia nitens TaxID=1686743 RepID=UPI0023DAFECA|nr:potassium channel subfamily K member 2-like [Oppia nitens]